jgi:tetratricopeptide (TPR) repeat protein
MRIAAGTIVVALAWAGSASGQPARPRVAPVAPAEIQAVEQLIASGQLDAAEARLRQALGARDSAPGRTLLGSVLLRQGRGSEAEAEYRAALRLGAANRVAQQGLVRSLLAQEKLDEATVQLRRVAALGPLEKDLALKLAGIERAAGNKAAAEQQLRSAALRFKSVEALLALGELRLAAGDGSGARKAIEEARVLAPNSEDVLVACARSWLRLKQPDRALPSLEALVRLFPTVGEYHSWRGEALLKTGDVEAALRELQEADRLEPRRAATLMGIGEALNRLKRFDEAARSLEASLALEPENGDAWAALARAQEGEGKTVEAEATARRVLARQPNHGAANLVLGSLLMKQGKFDEARAALERAVASEPSAKAHYQLSLAYGRLGDAARAQAQRALFETAAKEEEERMKALGKLSGMGTIR